MDLQVSTGHIERTTTSLMTGIVIGFMTAAEAMKRQIYIPGTVPRPLSRMASNRIRKSEVRIGRSSSSDPYPADERGRDECPE
jgi:hypothetical protein